jgi:lysine-N-methylase
MDCCLQFAGRSFAHGEKQHLRSAKIIRPRYVEQFRCIGGDCEDSCCVGWSVAIDKQTFDKYQLIPAGALRNLIDTNVLRSPCNADGSAPPEYASMQMSPSNKCPMHNADNLCQIQLEHGEGYLSRTCSTFPRQTYTIDKLEETTLTLSCPEAARIVLTNTRLLGHPDQQYGVKSWDDKPGSHTKPIRYFWHIREFTVTLLQNRNYALWQRLFLLGTFSRRLETVFQQGAQGNFSALETGFSQAIAQGTLRKSMESMPANNALQLDLVLCLAKLPLGAGNDVRPRLIECLNVFLAGIGHGTLSFEKQCEAYAAAYKDFYEPFFLKFPGTLENLLLNMVFRSAFPFGTGIFANQKTVEPARQYALLVTEFALIKGLLIGVAGARKQAFCLDDVVRTVQLVVKHFEHSERFVSLCLEMLAAKGLDNAYGLTMLLRN